MNLGIQGKTALVTAASKGLGFATAKGLAKEGANVVLASRDMAALERAKEEIHGQTQNTNVLVVPADLTKEQEIVHIFDEAGRHFGGVDILVNNAGGPRAGSFSDLTDEDWITAHELTLLSVIRAIRMALPYMQKNRWGRIVNFTSSSMKQPIDHLILSNTYRTAVTGLSKSLAIEYAKDNILINTLGPGKIATDRVKSLEVHRAEQTGLSLEEVSHEAIAQIPMGRYGTPDEFARMAIFLASEANAYLTGQSILVDGGLVRSL